MEITLSDRLEISGDCCLESYDHYGVVLCYVEHQADSYYSDTETTVDIDKDLAVKIIEWLTEKYQLE